MKGDMVLRQSQLCTDYLPADTGVVKGATAELKKNYYTKPESLLWLLQILTTNEESYVDSIQDSRTSQLTSI